MQASQKPAACWPMDMKAVSTAEAPRDPQLKIAIVPMAAPEALLMSSEFAANAGCSGIRPEESLMHATRPRSALVQRPSAPARRLLGRR